MRTKSWIGALAALLVTAGAAHGAAAKYPASVAGNWNVVGNATQGVLALKQGGGKNLCRVVTGTIYGSDAVNGIYCPTTGRLVFARSADGQTVQVWQAQLSRISKGEIMMAGSLASVRNLGGAPGEYAFLGVKP